MATVSLSVAGPEAERRLGAGSAPAWAAGFIGSSQVSRGAQGQRGCVRGGGLVITMAPCKRLACSGCSAVQPASITIHQAVAVLLQLGLALVGLGRRTRGWGCRQWAAALGALGAGSRGCVFGVCKACGWVRGWRVERRGRVEFNLTRYGFSCWPAKGNPFAMHPGRPGLQLSCLQPQPLRLPSEPTVQALAPQARKNACSSDLTMSDCCVDTCSLSGWLFAPS